MTQAPSSSRLDFVPISASLPPSPLVSSDNPVSEPFATGTACVSCRAMNLNFLCAVFRMLLVAVCIAHLPVCVTTKAIPELAGATNVPARCSELSARRGGLHAEIERLHAEAALVEAQLGALCTEWTNQTAVGVPSPFALPSQSNVATRVQIMQGTNATASQRRGGELRSTSTQNNFLCNSGAWKTHNAILKCRGSSRCWEGRRLVRIRL
jgi:hypothetical protein